MCIRDSFTYRKLLRFTLPSIVMMVISSIYSVVDGLFVANLIGDFALSAVNIIFPFAMIIGAFGFMLGTGGSALVARTLGEGDEALARRYFSMIVYSVILLGAVLSILLVLFVEPIARMAGASDALIADCVTYGRILLAGSVPFMLQTSFQSFFVVAEKPHLGLLLSVAAGVTNMALDYLLIAVIPLGIAGAALATVLGYCVGGLIPLFYFCGKAVSYTHLDVYKRQGEGGGKNSLKAGDEQQPGGERVNGAIAAQSERGLFFKSHGRRPPFHSNDSGFQTVRRTVRAVPSAVHGCPLL